MSKNSHKYRVKQRNHTVPEKTKKNYFRKIFICILCVLFLYISFNIFFVSKETVESCIQVKDIQLISNGGTNTYLQYGKRNSRWIDIDYPAIYKITAETDTGEIICFEYTGDAYNAFSYKAKHTVEYEVRTIFKKTKINFKKKIKTEYLY